MKGILLSLVLSIVFSLPALSQVVGKIEKAKGRVSVLKKGSFRGINYKRVKGKIEVGDVVRTKRKSFADISFVDKTRVHLEESSRLIVEKYIPGKEVAINSPSGKVVYRVVKVTHGAYRIKTPTALIGVKGTELATIVDSGISVVVVKEGAVEVINPELPQYRVVVRRNMATVVKPGKPPAKPITISKTVIEKVFKGAKPKKEEGKLEEKQEKKPEKKSEEKKQVTVSSKEETVESKKQPPAEVPPHQEQPVTEAPPPVQEIPSPAVTAPLPTEELVPTEEVSPPEETFTTDTIHVEEYTETVAEEVTHETTQEEVNQGDVTHEEVSQEDIIQEEAMQEETIQEGVNQEGLTHEEVSQEEIVQEEMVQETAQEITQEEVTEEVITEAIANVKIENGIMKLNVAIPSTDTPE